MNILTIKVEYCNLWDSEFQDYLLSLKGIFNIINDKEMDECITIEYNNNITLNIIMKEIALYFDINNIPSVSSFHKHMETELNEYVFDIEHLCCEFCLFSNIEELLYIEGISEVYTNFDKVGVYNTVVHIIYGENELKEDSLLKIKMNFVS